ncbi:MAG: outer membrane beta-barrel domain-containing protein [Bdellovibrionia bacterium]
MGTSTSNFVTGILVSGVLFLSSTALGQASQYQRAKKAEPKAAAPAPADGAPAASPAPGSELDKKVDITDLEQKYWVPKDTEFHVVQNRTYTKEHRFAATIGFGPLINDQYSKATVLAFAGNYYFSERLGAELTYMTYATTNNRMTEEFLGTYAVIPEHNKEKEFIGAAVNWIPIYAKLALLDKQIIYFDMSFSAGLGMTTYEQQLVNMPATRGQAPTISFDVAQHFFLGKHLALRADIRNHFFNWDVKDSRTGAVSRTSSTNSNTFLLGLTFYF